MVIDIETGGLLAPLIARLELCILEHDLIPVTLQIIAMLFHKELNAQDIED